MFQSFYMVLFIFSLMFDSWWYESNLPIAPCPGLGAWRKFGCRLALMLWLGLPFDIPTSSMVSCLISDDLIMFPTQVPPETSTHASAAWGSGFFRAEISLLLVGFILQHSYTLTPPSTISCVPQWRRGTNFAAFSSSFLRYLQQMLLLSGSHFPLGVQVRVSEPGSINPGLMFVAGYPEPRHHRPLLRLKKVSRPKKLFATQLPHSYLINGFIPHFWWPDYVPHSGTSKNINACFCRLGRVFFSGGNLIALGRLHSSTLLDTQ